MILFVFSNDQSTTTTTFTTTRAEGRWECRMSIGDTEIVRPFYNLEDLQVWFQINLEFLRDFGSITKLAKADLGYSDQESFQLTVDMACIIFGCFADAGLPTPDADEVLANSSPSSLN